MKVRVPASSANIGPGFDCFGIAWQLYNEIEFLTGGNALEITGCPKYYCDENNLCYVGYTAALSARGLQKSPVSINFLKTEIPISRGLGSSASLIVSGIAAADALFGLKLTDEELLRVAAAAEGHPDNVAPSLFGGFRASFMGGGKILSVPLKLGGGLYFTALIPDFKLSTKKARGVLPAKLARADAVFNVSHTALLIKAMESGDVRLMSEALKDRVHQPYRQKLIDGYETAEKLALDAGAAGVCISGAGPSLLCVSGSAGFSEEIKTRLAEILPGWSVLPLLADFEGAKIL